MLVFTKRVPTQMDTAHEDTSLLLPCKHNGSYYETPWKDFRLPSTRQLVRVAKDYVFGMSKDSVPRSDAKSKVRGILLLSGTRCIL